MPAREITETLRTALEYRESGLCVIPLRPRDKHPLIDWKPYQARRSTDEELTRWFSGGLNNVGVVGGAVSGGLCMIDFDSMEAYDQWLEDNADYWLIPSVQTTKGRHVYVRLKHWPGNKRDVQRGIDIRGEGGYCVAPPSVHPSGLRYYWVMGGPKKIPTFDSLDNLGFGYLLHHTTSHQPMDGASNEMPYSIRPFVTKGTFIGNRDRKAYWAACECRAAGVNTATAIELIAAGLNLSSPDRDPIEWATEKVRSAYGRTA